MFAKVAVLLFAGCAVALARPQDTSALQQQLQAQQLLNPNQPQQQFNQLQGWTSNQLQGLNQNQIQALLLGQLQGLNQNQLQALISQVQYNPNQLLYPGSNNGYNGNYNGNTKYQTPLLDLPNHALDWGQNVIDGGVSRVGSALGQAFDNTERVANNAIDTVGEVGRRGFQDGSSLVKSGLGIFTAFPKIGLGLLSRQNNNGYGY